MRDVLLATRNPHKLAEIRDLLADLPVRIVSPADAGLPHDPAEEGVEAWETFMENALAKAASFRARTGLPTMADDSGLCVDALDGGPGVHSRRFAPEADIGSGDRDAANNRHLLRRLEDVPRERRGAHYRCALALIDDRFRVVVYGRCDGRIATSPLGDGGFGYDPLFVVPELERTFGELPPAEKAARSHRAAAVRGVRPWLIPDVPTPPGPVAAGPPGPASAVQGGSTRSSSEVTGR